MWNFSYGGYPGVVEVPTHYESDGSLYIEKGPVANFAIAYSTGFKINNSEVLHVQFRAYSNTAGWAGYWGIVNALWQHAYTNGSLSPSDNIKFSYNTYDKSPNVAGPHLDFCSSTGTVLSSEISASRIDWTQTQDMWYDYDAYWNESNNFARMTMNETWYDNENTNGYFENYNFEEFLLGIMAYAPSGTEYARFDYIRIWQEVSEQPTTSVGSEVSLYTPHAPIFIDGESQFVPANGVTGGSGSVSDPYVIEGWDIDATTANGIEIRNTTACFVIRNVMVHDGQPNNYQAISLQNVSRGIVTNVASTNNVGLISMTGVSNSSVLNSTASDHGVITVSRGSHYNLVAFNTLDSGGWGCINIEGDSNDVIGNTVTNWGNGIGVSGNFNTIIDNKITPPGIWYALWVGGGASNNTIQGNDISGGSEGISFDVGYDNAIIGNHVHDTGAGIGIVYGNPAVGNLFVGNTIEDNGVGIEIAWEGWGSGPSYGNFFFNNYLRNSYNTYDDGTNNWNTTKTLGTNILVGPYLGGNYYNDYTGTDADHDGIGDTPYYISGGGNVDYLPLVAYVPPPAQAAIDVQAKVGSIHFRGEMAEFYILVSSQGNPVDANITATLYHNGLFYQSLSSLVERISAGLYWIPYTIQSNAPTGTYAAVIEAQSSTYKGVALENFLLSPTLTGWNALLTSINGNVATIKTDMGLITVKLDDINATLLTVKDTTVSIQTNLGTIMTTLEAINARITSMNGTIAEIETNLGTVKSSIDDIKLKVIAINGTTVAIQTTLGTMNGTITSIANGIANVHSDLGSVKLSLATMNITLQNIFQKVLAINGTTATIQTRIGVMNGTITSIKNDVATIIVPGVGMMQADISSMKGTQETWTLPVQYVIIALVLIAAAGSVLSIVLIRRRKLPK